MLAHEVKQRIESGLKHTTCYVSEFSGGTDHYSVVVVGDLFEGVHLLKRHRMVLDLFQDEISSGEVHALTIKAWTLKQWKENSRPSEMIDK
ncbi:MAG: BolA/IbaG family iron-sulfur metabolism protein [Silvanigrellaceae bacterium]|nr:BolA/IbaG family iron-sulfur metabolism protein [Silvanigrellaceae bacterium]